MPRKVLIAIPSFFLFRLDSLTVALTNMKLGRQIKFSDLMNVVMVCESIETVVVFVVVWVGHSHDNNVTAHRLRSLQYDPEPFHLTPLANQLKIYTMVALSGMCMCMYITDKEKHCGRRNLTPGYISSS